MWISRIGSILERLQPGIRLERLAERLSSLSLDAITADAVRKGSHEASAMPWGADGGDKYGFRSGSIILERL